MILLKSNGFAFNTNVPGALIVPSGPCERPVNIRIASIYGDSVHLIPCHLLRGSFTKTLFPHFIRTDIAQDRFRHCDVLLTHQTTLVFLEGDLRSPWSCSGGADKTTRWNVWGRSSSWWASIRWLIAGRPLIKDHDHDKIWITNW